ncbi:peptidylprolyl isomerase [Rugosimonospora acidiphila]|uniref:peptidylprolyl isomerase n=1 Tax=Rugosimonospora acidiphila TaxID=556531 RepID=UPI0031EC506F
MASSKTRQRKLARAKIERQQARRFARARRNRQVQAGVAVGLVVVVGVVITLLTTGVFSGSPKPKAAPASCEWNTPPNTESLTSVGKPPTNGEPRTGTETMTIATNQGSIAVDLNLDQSPCAASSFSYLAGKKFFDNTKCSRLVTSGMFTLTCGDPKGDGTGGPAYTFANEYVPSTPASASPSAPATASPDPSASSTAGQVIYPRGTVALWNSAPDTNGSQFFIVYKDTPLNPQYTVVGTVSTGMDVVDKVAAGGAVDSSGKTTTDGTPKTDLTIQTLTVAKPASASPSAGPSTGASGSPSVAPTTSTPASAAGNA